MLNQHDPARIRRQAANSAERVRTTQMVGPFITHTTINMIGVKIMSIKKTSNPPHPRLGSFLHQCQRCYGPYERVEAVGAVAVGYAINCEGAHFIF